MQINQNWLKQLPIKNIISCQSVRGGDINLAYKIVTPQQQI